ncbi:cytochrome P450 [Schizophyllum commune]
MQTAMEGLFNSSHLVRLTIASCMVALALWRLLARRRYLENVPGPQGSHPLLGHLPLRLRSQAAQIDFDWVNQYGNIVKFDGAFGERRLLITDPKALHHIMQTSGYTYIRSEDRKEPMRTLLGKGVLVVEGECMGDDHRRQRKILMPSFNSVEANGYVPSFASKAAQMAEEWIDMMPNDGGMVVDIPSWVARATLDALGEAALDYQFDALDDPTHNKLVSVYTNLLAKIRFAPTDLEVLALEALALIPRPLKRWWNDHVPNKRRAYMKRCREVAEGVARELVQRQRPAVSAGEGSTRRDVLSRLVAANAAADPKTRLGEDEVYAQLLTILLAGHETTANSLSWALLELAQAPSIQDRLRAEILASRSARSTAFLTADDIHAMPFLNAVVQEVLRFHTSVIDTARTATRDDVIPLSRPLLDRKGRPVYEVAVRKGQHILVSIAAYQRNKDLYGPDADRFNPERWLKEGYVSQKAGGGIYSNLLTFGGGHRACPGWRFAVLELSAFLVELVGRFEFSVSPDVVARVYRGAAGVMIPMLEGELEKGVQLPLHVKPALVE